MALRGTAAVPEQLERGSQSEAPPRPPPAATSPQRQALGLGFASALLLPIMGQLSKRFVVQHVLPSFPSEIAERERNWKQENLRSRMSLPFGID